MDAASWPWRFDSERGRVCFREYVGWGSMNEWIEFSIDIEGFLTANID